MILGIGNPLRGDDGFGPALVARLQGNPFVRCFDVGTAPENYLGKIVKENPDTVLLVDAVHLEQSAGTIAILAKDEIVKSGFTTHDLSPTLFIEYLEQNTQAKIFLLGVQPRTIAFGEEFSTPVLQAIGMVEKMILEALDARNPSH